jgi:reactive intermediate/imine deaminase
MRGAASTFGPDDGIPAPVAPYSHAVRLGPQLFLTGQLPIDPATGGLVAGGIEEQTDAVMAHLQRVLTHCGASLGDAVQARAYLTSMELYEGFNRAYAKWFDGDLPARTCIGVTGLALGALVEVDLVAAVPPADVVTEVTAAFERYEAALAANDARVMNALFADDDTVVRFGIADQQFGRAELRAWRSSQPPLAAGRVLDRTAVTAIGDDAAVVTTLFRYPDSSDVGRQTQVWARRREGWRIVSAHVSQVPT